MGGIQGCLEGPHMGKLLTLTLCGRNGCFQNTKWWWWWWWWWIYTNLLLQNNSAITGQYYLYVIISKHDDILFFIYRDIRPPASTLHLSCLPLSNWSSSQTLHFRHLARTGCTIAVWGSFSGSCGVWRPATWGCWRQSDWSCHSGQDLCSDSYWTSAVKQNKSRN